MSTVRTTVRRPRGIGRALPWLGLAVPLVLSVPGKVQAAQVRVPAWSEFIRCRPAPNPDGGAAEGPNLLRRLATCALPMDKEQGFGTVLEPGRLQYGFVVVRYGGRTADGTQFVLQRRQQLAFDCSSSKLITRTVGSRLLDASGAVVKESSDLTLWRTHGSFANDRKAVEKQFLARCVASRPAAAKRP